MTDFLVSQNNSPQLPASHDWQKEAYSQTLRNQSQAIDGEPQSEINLKEALEWLLGSEPADGVEDETFSRKERRMDLLIWLMNLELRLSPYGEPA